MRLHFLTLCARGMVSSTSYFHQGRCSLSLPPPLSLSLSLSRSLFYVLFLSVAPFSPRESYILSFSVLWTLQSFIPLSGTLLDARSTGERDSANRRIGGGGRGSLLFAHDALALKTFASRCSARASRLALKRREGGGGGGGKREPGGKVLFQDSRYFDRARRRSRGSHAATRIQITRIPNARTKESSLEERCK